MPENDRGMGSEGLEQGGPGLGNERDIRDSGDALTNPNTEGLETQTDDDTLNMDSESSRNLSGESDEDADLDDVDADDDDLEDDDDELDLDDDDDDVEDSEAGKEQL